MVKKAPKAFLIITSSGGSGHIQAASAKAFELKRKFPHAEIHSVDILLNWVGRRVGRFFVGLWNEAQSQGNITKLRWLIGCQFLQNLVFFLPVFCRAFFTLWRHHIDHVIDTQPSFTVPIVKAVKWASFLQKRAIVFEKIITELPTERCVHFFNPIKQLSDKDKISVRLVSGRPLLQPDQTSEAFWQQTCGMSEEHINYQEMPLRPAFRKYSIQKERFRPIHLKIQTHGDEERALIHECLKKGASPYLFEDDRLHITLQPDDKIYTVMLGSCPAQKATLKYVQLILEALKERVNEGFFYQVFVFCNDHKPGKNSLLKQVHDLILSSKEFPSNLTIIPLSFQDDNVIAPLFFRSDATFTRSGGLTSMELMAVAKGQICIHSEAKDPSKLDLGMPQWEFGNASYLREKKGAKILTTSTFAQFCHELFDLTNCGYVEPAQSFEPVLITK